MRLLAKTAALIAVITMTMVGCSSNNPVQAPEQNNNVAMAPGTNMGTGSFTVEAKYTYFRSYPGGRALFLLKITPGADFVGDAIVSLSSDRLLKGEFTTTHINAETGMTELLIDASKQLEIGFYYVTVTVENQTCVQTVEFEIEIFSWGILSMNNALDARDNFVGWLEAEHPEFGSFTGELWTDIYCQYPLRIVEHYTHLSDNWEMRVGCHVTWTPEDYYEVYWLRPRGQWNPIVAAKMTWDLDTQTYVINEMSVDDWIYYYGY